MKHGGPKCIWHFLFVNEPVKSNRRCWIERKDRLVSELDGRVRECGRRDLVPCEYIHATSQPGHGLVEMPERNNAVGIDTRTNRLGLIGSKGRIHAKRYTVLRPAVNGEGTDIAQSAILAASQRSKSAHAPAFDSFITWYAQAPPQLPNDSSSGTGQQG